MKIFKRLLKYLGKYKKRFITGLFFAFFLSVSSGISLSALKPIFDIIGTGAEKPFQLGFSNDEIKNLSQTDVREDLIKLFNKHPIYADARDTIKPVDENFKMGIMDTFRTGIAKLKLRMNSYFIKFKPFKLLINVSLAILPIYLLKMICAMGTVYFISSTGLLAVRDIRKELYDNLLSLPIHHFVHEKAGAWMSRVINDVTILSDTLAGDFRVSINNLFIVITHLMLLALIDIKLLLISLFGFPLVLWPVNYFAKRIKGITSNEQSRLADINGHMQEIISGIRVIRAFSMEPYEKIQFTKINNQLYRESFRFRFFHSVGPSLVEFASSLIVVGMIIYGGQQIMGGKISPGTFFMFLFTLTVIMSPIKQLASWYNIVNRMIATGERIFKLIDEESEVEEPENPKTLKKVKNSVSYNNVFFSYPGTTQNVLNDISISVPAGSTVALVGPSGAGKSTFVDLLSRFYNPTSGSIEFDNINVKDMPLSHLRSKIGIVTQEIFLFNASISDNIAYGQTEINEKTIIQKAKLAYAHEFISKLPEQYETNIGERGQILSGGQRQRISIARALLKNPEILILDEATSALDTESERLVQKALERLMKNRTTFVIAHRLSTIYRADMILVFDNGQIIEKGTHSSLLRKKGLYKRLYDMQFQD